MSFSCCLSESLLLRITINTIYQECDTYSSLLVLASIIIPVPMYSLLYVQNPEITKSLNSADDTYLVHVSGLQ